MTLASTLTLVNLSLVLANLAMLAALSRRYRRIRELEMRLQGLRPRPPKGSRPRAIAPSNEMPPPPDPGPTAGFRDPFR